MFGKVIISTLFLLFLQSLGAAQIASGGGFSLEKSVFAGGGGQTSSGGNFALGGTVGQAGAGTNMNGGGINEIGGFWTPEALQPTAATVSIGGRVKTADGRGIRNAIVNLIALDGTVKTVVTGSLGTFRLTEVEIGQIYVLSVASKRFVFENPARLIEVTEELTGLEFTASER